MVGGDRLCRLRPTACDPSEACDGDPSPSAVGPFLRFGAFLHTEGFDRAEINLQCLGCGPICYWVLGFFLFTTHPNCPISFLHPLHSLRKHNHAALTLSRSAGGLLCGDGTGTDSACGLSHSAELLRVDDLGDASNQQAEVRRGTVTMGQMFGATKRACLEGKRDSSQLFLRPRSTCCSACPSVFFLELVRTRNATEVVRARKNSSDLQVIAWGMAEGECLLFHVRPRFHVSGCRPVPYLLDEQGQYQNPYDRGFLRVSGDDRRTGETERGPIGFIGTPVREYATLVHRRVYLSAWLS